MPNSYILNFVNSETEVGLTQVSKFNKGILPLEASSTEISDHVKEFETKVDLTPINDEGDTEETILKKAYMDHEKRLLTSIENDEGENEIATLEGVIFPVSEIESIIGNKEVKIEWLYIEFCVHKHLSDDKQDKFSFMLTGLDADDNRIRTEVGESRVYEFAQSSPPRRVI